MAFTLPKKPGIPETSGVWILPETDIVSAQPMTVPTSLLFMSKIVKPTEEILCHQQIEITDKEDRWKQVTKEINEVDDKT